MMHKSLRQLIIAGVTFILGSSLIFAEEVGLYVPYGIKSTETGTQLVADTYSNRILEVKGDQVKVVAGKKALNGGFKDGEALEAYFDQPIDIAQDSEKSIYVTDSENHVIRKIVGGKVWTLTGTGKPGYLDSQDYTKAQFNQPMGLTIDDDDNLYVADTLNHTIRKIAPDGVVTTLAGTNKSGYKDGTLSEALFNEPTDVVITGDGVFYVVDSGNQAIRKIEKDRVTTVAGGTTKVVEETGYKMGGYVDGAKAQFNFPKSLVVLDNGEILVADTLNHAIRKIKTDGTVVTVLSTDSGLDSPVGLVYSPNKVTVVTVLSTDSGLDSPVGLVYSLNQVTVAQKWKGEVTTFTLEPEKIVKNSLTHEEWLNETPFLPKSEEVQLWLEGTQIIPKDVNAQLIDSRVYLPVRAIGEAVGATVIWEDKTQTATVTLGDKIITIQGTNENVKVVDGRVLIGLRFLAENLGLSVDWVMDYYAVVITR